MSLVEMISGWLSSMARKLTSCSIAQVKVSRHRDHAVGVAQRLGLGELVGAAGVEAVLGGDAVDGVEQVRLRLRRGVGLDDALLARGQFGVHLLEQRLFGRQGGGLFAQPLQPLFRQRDGSRWRPRPWARYRPEKNDIPQQRRQTASDSEHDQQAAVDFAASFAVLPRGVDLERLAGAAVIRAIDEIGGGVLEERRGIEQLDERRGVGSLAGDAGHIAVEIDDAGPGRRLDDAGELVERVQIEAGLRAETVEQLRSARGPCRSGGRAPWRACATGSRRAISALMPARYLRSA